MDRSADFDSVAVRDKAASLTVGSMTDREIITRLFFYVRDDIKFGFPDEGDLVKASDSAIPRPPCFLPCAKLAISPRGFISRLSPRIFRKAFSPASLIG